MVSGFVFVLRVSRNSSDTVSQQNVAPYPSGTSSSVTHLSITIDNATLLHTNARNCPKVFTLLSGMRSLSHPPMGTILMLHGVGHVHSAHDRLGENQPRGSLYGGAILMQARRASDQHFVSLLLCLDLSLRPPPLFLSHRSRLIGLCP